MEQHDVIRQDIIRHDMTRHDMTRHDPTHAMPSDDLHFDPRFSEMSPDALRGLVDERQGFGGFGRQGRVRSVRAFGSGGGMKDEEGDLL
jgi:hypothetical protein